MKILLIVLLSACAGLASAFAAEPPAKENSGAKSGIPALEATAPAKPKTPPTMATVHYGENELQVLDFWKAESAQPTPMLFYIHGGGWVAGDKALVADLGKFLAAGISVVSINYRYVTQAIIAGAKPP